MLNATAAFAVAHLSHLSDEVISSQLRQFNGVKRRFDFQIVRDDFVFIDDYAHHPTEIKAISTAIKQKEYHESWVIFQPHTYSRTKLLLNDFAEALSNFDNIILLDIYAAREKNTYDISSKNLAQALESKGKLVKYIPDFNEVVSFIKENVKDEDIIMTLGAGTVTKLGPMILEK